MTVRREKYDGVSRPINKTFEENFNRIFGKKKEEKHCLDCGELESECRCDIGGDDDLQ